MSAIIYDFFIERNKRIRQDVEEQLMELVELGLIPEEDFDAIVNKTMDEINSPVNDN